ncbi:rubisco accumulation factor 1.1, chloroplastic [Amborella trichopoda]|uniref:Rubisco accumulation factor 1 C-terminal domain-containing protein n=1 Tax=Amborella trichopoda TaxID=13333 RepID=W1NHC9_AMBTC|nr:rubisco accumulation factor 1.1, chloroplastic [Amborella trichopoda]ERM94903.1 hypothetical protein AMTR_s00009p00163120 [Amborella trichopoda]|eukprot:XP_006827487.1 rubisco accumulation factor 1.1, chloroplastic [Amborella trichopoda]
MVSLTSLPKHLFSFPPSTLQRKYQFLSLPHRPPLFLSLSNPRPPPPSFSPNPSEVYQPFRPPPSPLPSHYKTLDLESQLSILRDRLGRWFEYAPLISSLYRQGFSPSSLEESTGITGVEQNQLLVSSQVRSSIENALDPETLVFFDSPSSAPLLYELRLLSNTQRVAAAKYAMVNNLEIDGARELARAIKDFERRPASVRAGFTSSPGDCLAFSLFRQSAEVRIDSERSALLERALTLAETEEARKRIDETITSSPTEDEQKETTIRVPVVRMRTGEVAEAESIALMPVCEALVKEVETAPAWREEKGEFGVVRADVGWNRWVALPGWEPVAAASARVVAVAFIDARALPWKVKRWYKEEPVLVIVDREMREVEGEDGLYMVEREEGGVVVERGSVVSERGGNVRILGSVVMVVRPPKENVENQLQDEDWE